MLVGGVFDQHTQDREEDHSIEYEDDSYWSQEGGDEHGEVAYETAA